MHHAPWVWPAPWKVLLFIPHLRARAPPRGGEGEASFRRTGRNGDSHRGGFLDIASLTVPRGKESPTLDEGPLRVVWFRVTSEDRQSRAGVWGQACGLGHPSPPRVWDTPTPGGTGTRGEALRTGELACAPRPVTPSLCAQSVVPHASRPSLPPRMSGRGLGSDQRRGHAAPLPGLVLDLHLRYKSVITSKTCASCSVPTVFSTHFPHAFRKSHWRGQNAVSTQKHTKSKLGQQKGRQQRKGG